MGAVGAAQFFKSPPAGWKPEGWVPKAGTVTAVEVPPAEVVRGISFYLLWIVYFLGTSVGLVAIGEASPLLREAAKTGAWTTAGAGLGIMSIFNGLGRLFWGSVSDKYGRALALYGMAGVGVLTCFGILRLADGFTSILAGLSLAAFSYGGYLALMPALTADFYGAKNMGANYGMVFSAWGLCGFLVPGYFAGILDAARKAGGMAAGYERVFTLLAGLALGAGVISWGLLRSRKGLGLGAAR